MTISGHHYDEALRHTSGEQLRTWQARFLTVLRGGGVPGCGHLKLLLIYMAAINYMSPAEKAGLGRVVPHLGSNGLIKADRTLHSVLTDRHGIDHPDWQVCTVDDLLRALGYCIKMMDASDQEYKELVNTIAGWISRDETQLFKDVERKRAELDDAKNTDLSGIEQELKEKGKI